MNPNDFFNYAELERYVDRINRLLSKNNSDPNYVEALTTFAACLHTISLNIAQWNDKCKFSIHKHGALLKSFLDEVESHENGQLAANCLLLYVFFREFKYYSDDHIFNITDLSVAYRRLENVIESFAHNDNATKIAFEHIKGSVDNEIVRFVVNDQRFQLLLDKAESSAAIKNRIADLNVLLNNKTELIEALDKKISNLRTEYNFVGLYKGFQDVYAKKERHRKDAIRFTYGLGATLISIPLLVILSGIIGQLFGVDPANSVNSLKFLAIPLISAELFLFYYFRLKYLEVKSFDAQLLQLDLRMSLCQFVESYSKFATDIHKESPGLLANFESLIFSPIVAKESDIPPLVDGASQLIDLIKSRK